ncbi:hypothetical protein PVAP13_7NG295978 [Panicum virgatum]|uniref:Uncharacterized protein n=1 Tax=Panicum virgatum TaxID=38727 RepID=A0A8T0Q2K5_PANVG|nr:hypothetical protein PVAP13_7NG295978 [Panicum virgatum]
MSVFLAEAMTLSIKGPLLTPAESDRGVEVEPLQILSCE